MIFVSLSDVLENMPAAELHARLHNHGGHLYWYEIDAETNMPLRSETVAEEGLRILKHKAGQPHRDAAERARHIAACIACGLDPDKEPQSHSLAGLRKFPFMRETKIGFARDDLTVFLEPVEIGEAHRQNAKGIQAQQESNIIEIIETLGHDPKCLPPNPSGKPGVKASVRAAYAKRYIDYTLNKFDKAWERLRSAGEIVDAGRYSADRSVSADQPPSQLDL